MSPYDVKVVACETDGGMHLHGDSDLWCITHAGMIKLHITVHV